MDNLLRWLAMSLLVAFTATANAGEKFAPSGCDFEVTFPGRFETRELFSPAGQKTVLAKSPDGEPLKISAECWPLQAITPQEYAEVIGPKMAERGVKVHNVTLARKPVGDIVTLAGVAGEGRDTYQVRFISHFGSKTRLDLLIFEKATTPSDGNLAFRNSVRLR